MHGYYYSLHNMLGDIVRWALGPEAGDDSDAQEAQAVARRVRPLRRPGDPVDLTDKPDEEPREKPVIFAISSDDSDDNEYDLERDFIEPPALEEEDIVDLNARRPVVTLNELRRRNNIMINALGAWVANGPTRTKKANALLGRLNTTMTIDIFQRRNIGQTVIDMERTTIYQHTDTAEYSDYEATAMRPLMKDPGLTLYNAFSQRPKWGPSAAVRFPSEHNTVDVLFFHRLRVDIALQNQGLGRAILNRILQGLTMQTSRTYQMLDVCMVHMPMFRLLDTFYGFLIRHRAITGFIKRTRNPVLPAELFPQKWLTKRADKAQLQRDEKANKEFLLYEDVDMIWHTPFIWALFRTRHSLSLLPMPGLVLDDTYPLNDFFWELNKALGAFYYQPGAFAARIQTFEAPFALSAFSLVGAPVSKLLADYPRAVAHLSKHCIRLGNLDGDASPTVQGLFLFDGCMRPLAGAPPAQVRRSCALILAFLIDHCRVMHRPIVVSRATAAILTGLFEVDTLSAIFASDAKHLGCEMPTPAPRFFILPNGLHIWVPIRKPESTNLNGTVRYPVKPVEPVALDLEQALESDERLQEDDAGRAAKKQKTTTTTTSCLHCDSRTATRLSTTSVPFCNVSCHNDYYYAQDKE